MIRLAEVRNRNGNLPRRRHQNGAKGSSKPAFPLQNGAFAEWLAYSGFNHDDLAKVLDVHRNSISRWLREGSAPGAVMAFLRMYCWNKRAAEVAAEWQK